MDRALQKRFVPRMNNNISFLGFGALEIGRDWGLGDDTARKRPEEEQAKRVLDTILDRGINIIDTASAYHRSEERIGKFVSKRRAEYILASKCGEHNDEPNTYYDFSYDAVKQSIDNSLKLLRTDYIDLMQIHFGPDSEKVINEGETVQAMKDAQKEGKIKFLGASIDGELATRCIHSGDFDVMQLNYNILNQSNEDNIRLCKEKGIGVLIRGGLARGRLTSKVIPYLDSSNNEDKKIVEALELLNNDVEMLTAIALRFLYNNEGITSILIGTKNPERIDTNIKLLQTNIDELLFKQVVDILR